MFGNLTHAYVAHFPITFGGRGCGREGQAAALEEAGCLASVAQWVRQRSQVDIFGRQITAEPKGAVL